MHRPGSLDTYRVNRVTTQAFALGGTRWEIELAGLLAPGWAGCLASGLARRAISIERGHAIGDGQGLWAGRFEVTSPHDLRNLALAPLLAEDGDASARATIALEECAVLAVPEHGGSFHVVVRGRDCVGFLAALMRRFAYFSLFAVELRLDTRDGLADDQFWLRAGGCRRPATATEPALRSALRGLVSAAPPTGA